MQLVKSYVANMWNSKKLYLCDKKYLPRNSLNCDCELDVYPDLTDLYIAHLCFHRRLQHREIGQTGLWLHSRISILLVLVISLDLLTMRIIHLWPICY